jgi:hypothetical protein
MSDAERATKVPGGRPGSRECLRRIRQRVAA